MIPYRLAENVRYHLFHLRLQRLRRKKGRFDIQLGELRLPVGAQILVAKTAHNLVIPFEPRHHQQLLEQLRRLGQRVKRPFVDSARHEVVPRSFRRAPRQHGRFQFQIAVGVEEAADHLSRFVPNFKRALHGVAP